MIKLNSKKSVQSLNKQIKAIVQELQEDPLKMKGDLKKNKRINQYNRVIRMRKTVAAKKKLLTPKQQ